MKISVGAIVFAIIVLLSCITVPTCACTTIEPGHVGVAVNFGEVQPTVYEPGTHWTSPMYDWVDYDCREKTYSDDNIDVPTNDQMVTQIDVSVQYRADKNLASAMLSNTGTLPQVIETHLIPKLHAALRDKGKGVAKAEDLFDANIQERMQSELKAELDAFMRPKGVIVSDVFIRDIDLPIAIVNAIESRKVTEQQKEQATSKLDKFTTEQQERVRAAEADRDAAKAQAEQMRTMADARAYEIATQGKVLAANPDVLRWEAVKKWNGTLPTVMGGNSDLLLSIGSIAK